MQVDLSTEEIEELLACMSSADSEGMLGEEGWMLFRKIQELLPAAGG